MLLLPFLYDRQIGSIRKSRSSDCRPNLDYLLSRLVCTEKDVFVTWGEGVPVPPFSCKFRKDRESDLLAVANEDGEIYLIDTVRNKTVKNFTAHYNAIFDLCWLPDKAHLLTAAGDFRCGLIDMTTCQRVSTYHCHTCSVKTIDVCQGENGMMFAAGSKDGDISVWDIRENCQRLQCKPAIVIAQAHSRTSYNSSKRIYNLVPSSSSVSAVAFKDCNTLASAGVADSVIKIWDLRKTYVARNDRQHQSRYQIKSLDHKNQGYGFTHLLFNSLYTKLYACSTANKIFEVDCHSYTKKSAQFTGFKCSTYFIKMSLSHDDQYLVSGSSDNKAYIWKTTKPGVPIFELPGHEAEVTSVTWGAYDNTKIATCGDDNKVLIWKTKYSEDANFKYDKDVVGASCPYSRAVANEPSPSISDTISIFQSVTLVKPSKDTSSKDTPKFKSPPNPQDIKNFFTPLILTPSRPTSNKTPHNASPTPSKKNKASSLLTNQNKASPSLYNQRKASSPLSKQRKASASNKIRATSHLPKQKEAISLKTMQKEAFSPKIAASSPMTMQKEASSPKTNQNDASSPKANQNESSSPKANQNEASSPMTNQNKASSPKPNQIEASLPKTNQNEASPPRPTNQNKASSSNQSSMIQDEVSTPVARQPLSPRKNLQGSSSNGEVCTPQLNGKENGSGVKANGQTKRKLYLNDRFCKHHPDGCGRTRGHTRCGKRITIVPEKVNLKNYFSVTPE